MTGKIPRSLLAIGVIAAVMAVGAAAASATTVYSNFPSPKPGNVVSQAFEATSTSEFGGQVGFAGTQRSNPKVTVIMSSWACQNLQSGANCHSEPHSTFAWPITLNVYEVGAGEEPGAKIGSVTQTFQIPYRPSANKNCSVTPEGVVGWGKECFSGKAFKIHFEPLTGVKVPDKAIISIAYNTTDYGAEPTHSADVGEDSLNVGLEDEGTGPSVGTQPLPESAYVNSTWSGEYCDSGAGGTGTFRLDSGCWTGYQPLFKVVASK